MMGPTFPVTAWRFFLIPFGDFFDRSKVSIASSFVVPEDIPKIDMRITSDRH